MWLTPFCLLVVYFVLPCQLADCGNSIWQLGENLSISYDRIVSGSVGGDVDKWDTIRGRCNRIELRFFLVVVVVGAVDLGISGRKANECWKNSVE